jgi:septum formation protein
VVAPDVAELSDGQPAEVVLENALRKARALEPRARAGATVIAGDTEVALDGEVIGQPGDEGDAIAYLRRLSGRTHQVLGALAILTPGRGGGPRERSGVEVSSVRFRELGAELVDAYIASGEWRGRAGGYAIQGLGSALVESVEGDVSNVIGLPVPLLLRLAPGLVDDRARS